MSIPISLIWNLQMNLPQKIGTGISFCAGFTTIIVAFIRVFTLHANRSSQINISWLAFWATIEGCIAICVNCIPAFAFLVRNKINDSRDRKAANSNSAGYGQMGSSSRRKADGDDGGVMMTPMGRGEKGAPGDAHREGRYVAIVSVGSVRRMKNVMDSSSQESIIGAARDMDGVHVTRTTQIS